MIYNLNTFKGKLVMEISLVNRIKIETLTDELLTITDDVNESLKVLQAKSKVLKRRISKLLGKEVNDGEI